MTSKPAAKPKRGKGAGRPRGSNREATLARILPAARHLFASNGYTQTTFKEVGKAVGLSHAALYSYFPSKAELYLATTEHAQSILRPLYLAAIEQSDSFKERMAQILLASARAHDEDSSITGFLATIPIEIQRHPEIAKLLLGRQNSTFELLASVFEEAQKNGEIRSMASPEDLVIAIMGAATGIALLQYGMQRSSLVDSIKVLIELIEAPLFQARNCVGTDR